MLRETLSRDHVPLARYITGVRDVLVHAFITEIVDVTFRGICAGYFMLSDLSFISTLFMLRQTTNCPRKRREEYSTPRDKMMRLSHWFGCRVIAVSGLSPKHSQACPLLGCT